MYDVVKVGGVTFLEALLLGLFLVLAFSFMSALAGFFPPANALGSTC
jgi:membrane glycosyltransferase